MFIPSVLRYLHSFGPGGGAPGGFNLLQAQHHSQLGGMRPFSTAPSEAFGEEAFLRRQRVPKRGATVVKRNLTKRGHWVVE